MRILLVTVLLMAGLVFCQEDGAAEPEKAFSGSVSLSVVSKYLWRGYNLHDNIALQPGAEAVYKEFTLGFWGSENLIEEETRGFAEADFYFSWDKTLPCCEKLALSAGYNLYTYPVSYDIEDQAVDHELSLGLAVDVMAAPYLIYYLSPTDQFDGMQSQYLEIGGSHDIEVRENFTVGLSATAGYAFYKDENDEWEGDASVLGFSVSPVYSTVVDVNPVLFYQVPLGEDYEADFYAGLTVSYGF